MIDNSPNTLMPFLLARIAEDEAVARGAVIAAFDGYKPHPALSRWKYEPWTPDGSGEVEYAQTAEMQDHKYPERIYVTCDSEGLSPAVREEVGPHIARHDPARVLAECAAKRAIVAAHIVTTLGYEGAVSANACRTCVQFHADMDCENETWPCSTMRHLAAIYADHDDYRDEWRP